LYLTAFTGSACAFARLSPFLPAARAGITRRRSRQPLPGEVLVSVRVDVRERGGEVGVVTRVNAVAEQLAQAPEVLRARRKRQEPHVALGPRALLETI